MRHIRSVSLTVLGVLLCVVGQARASVAWSVAGNSCVPIETAIQYNRYSIVSATIKHSTNNVDTVTAMCAVSHSSTTNANQIHVRYHDTDDTTAATYVQAQFIKMARSSGTVTTIVGFNSNSDCVSCAGTAVEEYKAFSSHTFDFDTYAYYVRIDLDRGSTSDGASLSSVVLEYIVG